MGLIKWLITSARIALLQDRSGTSVRFSLVHHIIGGGRQGLRMITQEGEILMA